VWEPFANTKELAGETLLPVISQSIAKDVSPFGIVSLSGNVSEWTSSDAKLYPGNAAILKEQGLKVARGGSFATPKSKSATTTRFFIAASTRDPVLGFRLAMDKTN
jgi:formylglycine-generating enzyme required for sulfatase activity